MKCFVLLAAIVAIGSAQESFKCPDDYGFYPHSKSCDKYWKCEDNKADLKTCGNGLAFDASDPKYLTENCDYLHNVDCGERTLIEPAISTPHCPRLYGIFADEAKCDVFWNCWDGESSRYQCSPGLAYDREARVCMWADQVPECRNEASPGQAYVRVLRGCLRCGWNKRMPTEAKQAHWIISNISPSVLEEVAGGFSCPAAGELTNSGTFSRHAHPEDCRKYYICLEGVAREYGCPIGTVFKIGDAEGTGNCEGPEDVPGCEDYYGDLDLKSIRKSELLAGLQSSSGSHRNTAPAKSSSKPKSAPATPRNPPSKPAQHHAPETRHLDDN